MAVPGPPKRSSLLLHGCGPSFSPSRTPFTRYHITSHVDTTYMIKNKCSLLRYTHMTSNVGTIYIYDRQQVFIVEIHTRNGLRFGSPRIFGGLLPLRGRKRLRGSLPLVGAVVYAHRNLYGLRVLFHQQTSHPTPRKQDRGTIHPTQQ